MNQVKTNTKHDQTVMHKMPQQQLSFGKRMQNGLRKFGAFLAGMIMPLISLIIAWGLFTAIVLAAKTIIMEKEGLDSLPAARLFYMEQVIAIGIKYVIPVVVGFFAGKQVHDIKGGIIGVIATLGVIGGTAPFATLPVYENGVLTQPGDETLFNHVMVSITGNETLYGTEAPTMIMGAMIFAPLSAFVFKKIEVLWSDRIKSGFEMLVNNLSVGLYGLVIIFIGFWGIALFMAVIQSIFYIIINGIYDNNLLPILPIFVETEKVLFLNNAVNHGIFGPLGYNEVSSPAGKSVLFFMDPNPGQGMGLLLAYLFFSSKKEEKGQAAAAAPIHFIGGIHEVYYPFVLTKPLNLLWLICGGVFATFMYQIFDVGGLFTPSPGSIIMNYLACNTQPMDYAGLSLAIFGAMAVTFILTSAMLIIQRKKNGDRVYFNPKFARIQALYNKGSSVQPLFDVNKLKPIKNVHYDKSVKTKKVDGQELNVKYKWEKITYADGSQDFFVLSNKKYIVKFYYEEIPVINKKTGEQKVSEGQPKVKTYLYRVFYKYRDDKQLYYIEESQIAKPVESLQIKNDLFLRGQKKKTDFGENKDFKVKKIKLAKSDKKISSIEYVELDDIRQTRTIDYLPKQNKKGKDVKVKSTKEKYWQLLPKENMKTLKEEIKKQELEAEKAAASVNDNLLEVAKKAKKIIFACEAGMGSSAMGAGLLRKYVTVEKIPDVKITNCAIKNLPQDVDIVVTQKTFQHLVPSVAPNAYVYAIDQFLKASEYDLLIKTLKKAKGA